MQVGEVAESFIGNYSLNEKFSLLCFYGVDSLSILTLHRVKKNQDLCNYFVYRSLLPAVFPLPNAFLTAFGLQLSVVESVGKTRAIIAGFRCPQNPSLPSRHDL